MRCPPRVILLAGLLGSPRQFHHTSLQALHTLLCVQGPRTFEGRVVVMDLAKSLQCLGPCPVLLLMYYLAHYSGYRAYVPVWEARATAVMAQLIEAGFKPSIYPGEGPLVILATS